MIERRDEPRAATRLDTELAAALRTLRVAELRLLGAWTAAVWGRAQSAPHEQILPRPAGGPMRIHDGRQH